MLIIKCINIFPIFSYFSFKFITTCIISLPIICNPKTFLVILQEFTRLFVIFHLIPILIIFVMSTIFIYLNTIPIFIISNYIIRWVSFYQITMVIILLLYPLWLCILYYIIIINLSLFIVFVLWGS